MRWQNTYRTGDRVEILLTFANGCQWVRGMVARTQRSNGNPIVRPDGARKYDWTVSRKAEIRKEKS